MTWFLNGRGDRIRTCDLVLPKHPRYQAAPTDIYKRVIRKNFIKNHFLGQKMVLVTIFLQLKIK